MPAFLSRLVDLMSLNNLDACLDLLPELPRQTPQEQNQVLDHIARANMDTALPLFRRILTRETDPALLGRALKRAGTHKLDHLARDIAEFVFYDDSRLEAEATRALERIAGPQALDCLIQISHTEKSTEDVLDAIQMIQERLDIAPACPCNAPAPEDTDPLELLAREEFQDQWQGVSQLAQDPRALAKALDQCLAQEGHPHLPLLLEAAAQNPSEGLADQLIPLMAEKQLSETHRFFLYAILAHLPGPVPTQALFHDAVNGSLPLKTAALMALDRHAPDLPELRQAVETGTPASQALVQTLLDAQCRGLIHSLMPSDPFVYIASNYLETAPLAVVDTFIQILEDRKMRSTRSKYQTLRNARHTEDEANWVAVIGAGRTQTQILQTRIRRAQLHATAFATGAAALEAMAHSRPLAVVCDLFASDMSAPDLAREIKKLYPSAPLPVMVSSFHLPRTKEDAMDALNSPHIDDVHPLPLPLGVIQSWKGTP